MNLKKLISRNLEITIGANMNRFWDIIISHIFNEVKPRLIVEIGSDKGLNTKKILDYCKDVENAKLISIDPSPSFDIEAMKEKYGRKFIPINDLSLNSLKTIYNCDILLIDGDHNWYTVYNELKLIEKNYNQKNFPIIILHDISWPYGRRDLYYNPDNIPSEFLHDYKQWGMKPNQNKLLKIGGINADLNNAVNENTPKNGVLTAIEDFLKQTSFKLTFYKINGFNGLGIIFPRNNSFNNFIAKLVYESDIGETVEKFYLEKIIDKNNLLNSQNNQIKILNEKNKQYIKKIETIDNTDLKDEIITLRNNNKKYIEQIKEFNKTKNQTQKLIKVNIRYENQINDLKEFNEVQKEQLLKLNRKNDEYQTEIQNLIKINTKQDDNLKDLNNENNKLSSQLKTFADSNKDYQNQIQKLITLNSKLQSQIKILEDANSTYKDTINYFEENNNTLIINNKVLTMNNDELISEKTNLIKQNSKLVDNNNQLKSINEKLYGENNQINKINTDLKNEIEIRMKNENENNSTIQALNDVNLRLEGDVKQLNEEKEILINKNNELKQLIGEFKSSNSWKITEPIRKLSFKVKHLFK